MSLLCVLIIHNWVFAACNGLLGHIYISMEKLGDFILRYPFAHMIISADLTGYVLLLSSTMEVFFSKVARFNTANNFRNASL